MSDTSENAFLRAIAAKIDEEVKAREGQSYTYKLEEDVAKELVDILWNKFMRYQD